jgi:CobQ-like glutamine amidotransferase family enzyme
VKLRIVHLYPRELGINGDVGNVLVLARRAEARGHEVDVVDVGLGADLPEDVDVVHIGSGPFAAVQTVQPDAVRHSAALRALRDEGVPILAVGGGWELLGQRIRHDDGELPGLGVFPTEVTRERRQSVGETVVTAPDGTVLTGFANHSARTTLEGDAKPLGSVVRGYGNDGSAGKDSGDEGVRFAASVGTHLHGCVLGMNPALADELLAAALRRRGETAPLQPVPADLVQLDDWARRSREALAGRVGYRA